MYLHSFWEKMRGARTLIIKNEFCEGTKLAHYSSWLLLAVWISLPVPELVYLSLSRVGPWQMCQYGCRSSVLGERHLNSPWCITLAATNLAELSSKSSYFPLPLTICFLFLDEVNILRMEINEGFLHPELMLYEWGFAELNCLRLYTDMSGEQRLRPPPPWRIKQKVQSPTSAISAAKFPGFLV